VFAASVNDQNPYLTDETGNRRFWPVRCGAINIDALTRDRDQLWAEAHQRYKADEKWWLDTTELNDLAQIEQEDRFRPGPWDDVILSWLENPQQRYETDGGAQLPVEPFDSTSDSTTVTDVLLHAVLKPLDRFTQSDQNEVSRCLSHHGWTRKQVRIEGHRKWFYVRPGNEK
jgi:predicted P-loop ATPase